MVLNITIPVGRKPEPDVKIKKKPDMSSVLRTLEEQKLKTTETNKALNLLDEGLSKSQKKKAVAEKKRVGMGKRTSSIRKRKTKKK